MANPFTLQIDSPKLMRGLRPSLRLPRNSGYLIQCQGAIGREGSLQILDPLTRMGMSFTKVLTGSINTTASITVVGVGTRFTTELVRGDTISVSGERRVVASIADNTHLTVKVAFSDLANDTAPFKVMEIIDPFPYPQAFLFTNRIIVCGRTGIYEWVNNALVSRLFTSPGSPWTAVEYFDYLYLTNGIVAVIRRATDGIFTTTSLLPRAESLLDVHGQIMAGAPGMISSDEGFGLGPFGDETFGG